MKLYYHINGEINMIFFKTIKKDYLESKGKNETFIEWLLIRKLNTTGKIIFSLFLWSIWIYLWTDIVMMVRIFQIAVLAEVILILKNVVFKIYRLLKNKTN